MDAPSNNIVLNQILPGDTAARWRTEAMRSHARPRLLYFNRGQGRITVAGLTSGYGPNNLIYIPAQTLYGYEVGAGVFGQMLTIPQNLSEEWPETSVHLRLRDVGQQADLRAMFEALERELFSDKTGHGRAAQYHLGLLSVFFERHLDSPDDAARHRTAPARLVAAYTDLVERDFRTKKNVADYAADLGVTATHLTRCANATCGRSALSLLNDRVHYEARLLLSESKLPVNHIAQQLGFRSAAYFTRAFQAKSGRTPSKFRQNENQRTKL